MNISIVIALPSLADGKKVRALLERHGMEVSSVVTTGAGALGAMGEMYHGILICAHHLPDMYYRDVLLDMPEDFEMILLASPRAISQAPSGLVCVELPLRIRDFLDTLEMVMAAQEKRLKKAARKNGRPKEEKEVIERAKSLLMDRNHMTEAEAHRYLQKTSMDMGNSLVETAEMVLLLH